MMSFAVNLSPDGRPATFTVQPSSGLQSISSGSIATPQLTTPYASVSCSSPGNFSLNRFGTTISNVAVTGFFTVAFVALTDTLYTPGFVAVP